jgi:integrase
MPRRQKTPAYRHNKTSDRAVVTLPDGQGGRKDIYLGRYGTPESRQEYARVILAWENSGRRLPEPEIGRPAPADLTINEILLAYDRHAEAYYVKDGRPTSEQWCIRSAAAFLKDSHGQVRAVDFGPLALMAIRDAMINPRVRIVEQIDPATGAVRKVEKTSRGFSRRTINKNLSRIKAIFKWAVSQELIDVEVYQRLAVVPGLLAGRSAARETDPVPPVAKEIVEATLPHLSPVVADMIRVQRLTACRPGEVVQLRACDLDRGKPVWEFRPERHKNQHRQRLRIVYIGPKAQAILRTYFTLDLSAFLFRPDESERQRNEQRTAARQSPRWQSHGPAARRDRGEAERGAPPARAPGDRYTTQSYSRAIARACKSAGLPHWAPNQLRHAAATEVRMGFGLEAAQVVLGHAKADVTQIYAEMDADAARRVMAEIG